jgi:type II secretory pathway pseudopilin PulG
MRVTSSESGFSLIELMVASMITLAVIGVALTTFSNAMVLNETTTQIADSNQNLRAGTNLMVRDLLQAGRNIPTGGISIPSGTGAILVQRPSPPGTSYAFDNMTLTSLGAITTGQAMGPIIEGKATDMLTILIEDSMLGELTVYPSTSTVPGNPAKLAADGSSLNVGASLSWLQGNPTDGISAIKKGDLIMFRTPDGAVMQTVTAIDSPNIRFETNDPFNLNQPGASAGSITQVLGSQLSVSRIFMFTYYVHKDSSQTPRLMRALNMFEPQALAGVIEDLELSYDLVDGTYNPTNVKTLPFTSTQGVTYNANQIRKANLHIGVRSEEKSARQNDYIRMDLSTIVDLRNLAFVDRYK